MMQGNLLVVTKLVIAETSLDFFISVRVRSPTRGYVFTDECLSIGVGGYPLFLSLVLSEVLLGVGVPPVLEQDREIAPSRSFGGG